MASIRRVRLNTSPLAKHLESMNLEATAAGKEVGLDMRTMELMRLHASQINGCGSCIKAHTALAVRAGEISERLAMLPSWRDSEYFTELECALLTLTEHLTSVSELGIPNEVYEEISKVLTEEQISVGSWIVIAINAANRVWIANNPPVRLPKELRR